MAPLFIESFITKNYPILFQKIELVMIMWIIVLLAIIIDLISGLRKASKDGIMHTSFGFRRTVTKTVQYYGLLSFAFMFDILASLVSPLPYLSMLSSIFLVFIEAKSVFEKVQKNDRHKVQENVKDLISLLEHRDDLAQGILNILQRTNQNPSKNDNADR